MQSDSLDMRQKFELVTSPTVAVSALRPMGAPPLQPEARGLLFVAANHQHWYISLKGLQPQAGKVYKLWFVADQGMVGASAFPARSGAPIELSSRQMPAGTKGGHGHPGERSPQPPRPPARRCSGPVRVYADQLGLTSAASPAASPPGWAGRCGG